jgi:hypothetical protein
MKIYVGISSVILLIGFLFFSGSGCTRIENPVIEEEVEQLLVVVDKQEVLDTELVDLEACGGAGTITWETDPKGLGSFSPDSGASVVYTPPDIDATVAIDIIARDDTGQTFRIQITITDEGPPPSPGDIVLNEVAWAGTLTSSYDEYLELKNCTGRPFYLSFWKCENAAGSEMPLVFSGRIEEHGVFLVANYPEGSEKTAITCRIDFAASALSLSNSSFGPFVLKDDEDVTFDTVGDGGNYTGGLNGEVKASLARFTDATEPGWDSSFWYTEGTCMNLADGTLGTPGAPNSDTPFETGPSEDDALGIITEFCLDVNEGEVEDWIEILVTRQGNIKGWVVTDLDGTDSSITCGTDCYVNEGDYILVAWSVGCMQEGQYFFIPDQNPPSTKDELVLQCDEAILDALCYYFSGDVLFDDEEEIQKYGWEGDPIILGDEKHAARKRIGEASYSPDLVASSWATDSAITPGEEN